MPQTKIFRLSLPLFLWLTEEVANRVDPDDARDAWPDNDTWDGAHIIRASLSEHPTRTLTIPVAVLNDAAQAIRIALDEEDRSGQNPNQNYEGRRAAESLLDELTEEREENPARPTHPYTFLGKTSNDEDVFERGLDALGLAFRVRTFRSRPDAVAYATTSRVTGADELWLYDEDTDAWVREGDTLRARVSEAAYPEEHIRAPGDEREENPAVGNVHLGRRFTMNERRALRAGHLNPQIEEAIARGHARESRPRGRQSAFGEVEEDRPAPSHRFAANCAVHRQLTAADFERRPNPESNRGRSGLGLGRHDAREARGGRFVSTPPCDACGKPTGADYMTDSEVCGDSDGPGFFICNRSRCSAKCEKLGVEERRALYTATRASSRRDNPADDVPLTS